MKKCLVFLTLLLLTGCMYPRRYTYEYNTGYRPYPNGYYYPGYQPQVYRGPAGGWEHERYHEHHGFHGHHHD